MAQAPTLSEAPCLHTGRLGGISKTSIEGRGGLAKSWASQNVQQGGGTSYTLLLQRQGGNLVSTKRVGVADCDPLSHSRFLSYTIGRLKKGVAGQRLPTAFPLNLFVFFTAPRRPLLPMLIEPTLSSSAQFEGRDLQYEMIKS